MTLRTWHFENAFVACALGSVVLVTRGLSTVFFLAKEAGWLVYFVALHAYSALVGCGVFALYPVWRRLWRRWHPLPS